MFEPTTKPRFFACPPGADFPRALVGGLLRRHVGAPPENLARVEIFVNTRRMQRRIFDLFDEGPALLLPKIRLITDLAHDPADHDIPTAVSPLRRRLELSQLIAGLLDQEPDLAPRSAIFDLSDSLALLLAEMHDEDVSPQDIARLDVTDSSGHWQRSQKFLGIVSPFFGDAGQQIPDETARQRRVIERRLEKWADEPPQHPIIVAGSTGSRGTTAMFMQAVARLPQGAIILPGFDFDLPTPVWGQLRNPLTSEDHPQFRFSRLLETAGIGRSDVACWDETIAPAAPRRNKLMSLALRPAPVTDQWMQEGPSFVGVDEATKNMSLIEAPSQRAEAVAIALALRQAADQGKTAALVTPDRLLTRRVKAALERWHIEPDISAGDPLDHLAPGRLMRHVSELFGAPLTAEGLLTLLKHPLVNTGGDERGQHLRWTHELERQIRRYGPPFPTRQGLQDWAEKGQETSARLDWANWFLGLVCDLPDIGTRSLGEHLDHHITVVELLAAGPGGKASPDLWDKQSGQETKRLIEQLQTEAIHGGALGPLDYIALFRAVLKQAEARDPLRPHPNIMIWGTLEARVQGADLVILGGLNEGTWPELPSPDPWLNREMRHEAGLLVPERRVGLSAHDFQQAIAAPTVILTRAVRDAETQTVPSRWLNRLTNLLGGMSDDGRMALDDIRDRGKVWLNRAVALETPVAVPPQPRPCPIPPVAARPKTLSVTAITRLIRDPYAIYAQYVLGLNRLDPIGKTPDAALRGTVIHKVLEQFIKQADMTAGLEVAHKLLMSIAADVMQADVPWPSARVLWQARLGQVANTFLQDETARRQIAQPVAWECRADHLFSEIGFTLRGTADRIDQTPDGGLIIYDYKTGSPPSKKQLQFFDKQLPLESILAQEGAFEKLDPAPVCGVTYIGLGSTPKIVAIPLGPEDIQKYRTEFISLISRFQQPDQGYLSRRAMVEVRYDGNYDHLARFGEWNEAQPPQATEVGK